MAPSWSAMFWSLGPVSWPSYWPSERSPRRPWSYSVFQVISSCSVAYPAEVHLWPVVDCSESAQKWSEMVYRWASKCWLVVTGMP